MTTQLWHGGWLKTRRTVNASQSATAYFPGHSNPTSTRSQEMAEYDDVLTNQPVVIDNVCSTCSPSRPRAHLALLRVRAQSRQASLVKIIQNVSSLPCMYLSHFYMELHTNHTPPQRRATKACPRHGRCSRRRCLHWPSSARVSWPSKNQVSYGAWDRYRLG